MQKSSQSTRRKGVGGLFGPKPKPIGKRSTSQGNANRANAGNTNNRNANRENTNQLNRGNTNQLNRGNTNQAKGNPIKIFADKVSKVNQSKVSANKVDSNKAHTNKINKNDIRVQHKYFEQQMNNSQMSNTQKSTSQMNGSHNSLNQSTEYINILIYGEGGVGKSTFINSLANYFKYEKFETALKFQTFCLEPLQLSLSLEDGDLRTIAVPSQPGEFEDFEQITGFKSYVFRSNFGGLSIRFIKTPSSYETGNQNQDLENYYKTLDLIRTYEKIHGICIVLKPNISRLTPTLEVHFRHISSLISDGHLGKVTFVFTSARTTFYRPGETKSIVQEFLKKLKESPPHLDVKMTKENTFCFDNEAYSLLVALKNDSFFSKSEQDRYLTSWNRGVVEGKRFLDHIMEGYNEGKRSSRYASKEQIMDGQQTMFIPIPDVDDEDISDELPVYNSFIEDKSNGLGETYNGEIDSHEGELHGCIDLRPIWAMERAKQKALIKQNVQPLNVHPQNLQHIQNVQITQDVRSFSENNPNYILLLKPLIDISLLIRQDIDGLKDRRNEIIERSNRDPTEYCFHNEVVEANNQALKSILDEKLEMLEIEETEVIKNLSGLMGILADNSIRSPFKKYMQYLTIKEFDYLPHNRTLHNYYVKAMLEDETSSIHKSFDEEQLFNMKYYGPMIKDLFEIQVRKLGRDTDMLQQYFQDILATQSGDFKYITEKINGSVSGASPKPPETSPKFTYNRFSHFRDIPEDPFVSTTQGISQERPGNMSLVPFREKNKTSKFNKLLSFFKIKTNK